MTTKIAYYDIRGLAQSIRFLLDYVGEDYEDVRYTLGPAPQYDNSRWRNVKFSLGMDFPNLPYYIDGDLVLTQSNAILRHLARKYNLYGEGLREQAFVDLLLDEIMDVRNDFVRLCYASQFTDEDVKAHKTKTKVKIDNFEKYLGDKKFFLGDKVMACDFHIFEMMSQHRKLDEKLFEDTPNLRAYLHRFAELPAIKHHMSLEKYQRITINNAYAKFK